MRLLYAARAHAFSFASVCFDDRASDGAPTSLMRVGEFFPIDDPGIILESRLSDKPLIRNFRRASNRFLVDCNI